MSLLSTGESLLEAPPSAGLRRIRPLPMSNIGGNDHFLGNSLIFSFCLRSHLKSVYFDVWRWVAENTPGVLSSRFDALCVEAVPDMGSSWHDSVYCSAPAHSERQTSWATAFVAPVTPCQTFGKKARVLGWPLMPVKARSQNRDGSTRAGFIPRPRLVQVLNAFSTWIGPFGGLPGHRSSAGVSDFPPAGVILSWPREVRTTRSLAAFWVLNAFNNSNIKSKSLSVFTSIRCPGRSDSDQGSKIFSQAHWKPLGTRLAYLSCGVPEVITSIAARASPSYRSSRLEPRAQHIARLSVLPYAWVFLASARAYRNPRFQAVPRVLNAFNTWIGLLGGLPGHRLHPADSAGVSGFPPAGVIWGSPRVHAARSLAAVWVLNAFNTSTVVGPRTLPLLTITSFGSTPCHCFRGVLVMPDPPK